jgi:hypothetical protein
MRLPGAIVDGVTQARDPAVRRRVRDDEEQQADGEADRHDPVAVDAA